jgi:hypothetical protein
MFVDDLTAPVNSEMKLEMWLNALQEWKQISGLNNVIEGKVRYVKR